jgi:hypothetical protein
LERHPVLSPKLLGNDEPERLTAERMEGVGDANLLWIDRIMCSWLLWARRSSSQYSDRSKNDEDFSLRGLTNVRAEWKLVCATANLLKLFRYGGIPAAA